MCIIGRIFFSEKPKFKNIRSLKEAFKKEVRHLLLARGEGQREV